MPRLLSRLSVSRLFTLAALLALPAQAHTPQADPTGLPEDAPAGARIAAQHDAEAQPGSPTRSIFLPPELRLEAEQAAALRNAQPGGLPNSMSAHAKQNEDMPETAMEPFLAIPDFNITPEDRKAGRWGQAVQDAIAVTKAHGGGTVRLLAHAYHIEGRDLILPSGVTLEGASHLPGPALLTTTSPQNFPYALLLDPGHTIHLDSDTALRHLALFSFSQTSRHISPLETLVHWQKAGTALTIDGDFTQRLPLPTEPATLTPSHKPLRPLAPLHNALGTLASDIELTDLFIMGFTQGLIAHDVARLRINGLVGDALNGLSLDGCRDSCRLVDVSWGTETPESFWLPLGALTISGPEGTLHATLPEGRRIPLLEGWPVHLWTAPTKTAPAPLPLGVGLLHRVTERRFTLASLQHTPEQAATLTELLKNGGRVRLALDLTYRPGTAFDLHNSEATSLQDTRAQNYHIAWKLGEGTNSPAGINGVAKGSRAPEQKGLLVSENAEAVQWLGGSLKDLEHPVVLDSTALNAPPSLLNSQIQAQGKSCVEILHGTAQISGASCTGGAPVVIGPDVGGIVALLGNRLNGSAVENHASFRPLVLDTTNGVVSGLNLPRAPTLEALPRCDEPTLGTEIYLSHLRKPAEAPGHGTGGRVVCTNAPTHTSVPSFGWASQFTGAPASE